MTGYALSPRAEADLEDIWDYTIRRWGGAQAEKYHAALMAAIARLGQNPGLGQDCAHIRPGYWRYGAGAHVIFYLITSDAIHVMRILHKSRDFPRHV